MKNSIREKAFEIFKIGIIGGGQLGKMMTQEAKKMGFYVSILDPTKDSPASQVADRQIIGNFYERDKIRELAQISDVITFDLEHIDSQALKDLALEGYTIHPSPKILEIIQDKSKQKDILNKNNVPIPKYKKIDTSNFSSSIEIIKEFGFPLVLKTCKGGYDGRGVFVIKNEEEFQNLIKSKPALLNSELLVEEFIDIEKELAVNVARNTKGEIKAYPVVEMIFDKRANICDMVIAPARIKKEIERKAKQIAVKIMNILDGVGIFGIEMFLTKNGKVLVNEIAPRPHNSGHYTIEACPTSQFEQHIRAITGLPLGSTDLLTPAVMINLLGEPGYEGEPIYIGIEEALAIPGVNVHIYGKKITKPFRKMGHVTVVDKDIEKAIKKAEKVKKIIKVISKK